MTASTSAVATERAYRFLFLPAENADASWLEFLPPILVQACKHSRLGLRMLSRALVQRWRLRRPDSLRIGQEIEWVLGGADAVHARALRLGVCALAAQLQREIRRDRVAVLRAAFGPIYEWAMGVEALSVQIPERLQRVSAGDAEAVRAAASEIGLGVMLALLADHELALRQRVALLFPRAQAEAVFSNPGWVDAHTAHRLAELSATGD
jgi:hypothetical protein